MTIDLGLELAQIVINLLGSILKNNPTEIEQALLAIVTKGYEAYEAQTGKPIDSSLIKPIDPLP